MTTPETYVSECCGSLFIPGHGPDNIVELPGLPPRAASGDRVVTVSPHRTVQMRRALKDDFIYEVYRNGECPNCGRINPVMEEVEL